MQKKIPAATKKRMILLLNLLKNWRKPRITSGEIALLLGVKDFLVRYDFAFLEFPAGHRGYRNGYEISALEKDIQAALLRRGENSSETTEKNLCIVGLGRLGAALLDDSFFEGSGFRVCAGFDSSLNRVELIRSTFELFPASRIESVCPAKKIEYALLCCDENEAQKMADRLVKAGIKGIVNYTRAVFAVPQNVKVQNISPAVALALLE